MTATPPDCALSPWTNPDNGKVYECVNGVWTEKGNGSGGGGGGGETLDTVTTNGNETTNDIKVGTKVQLGNRHSLEVVESREINFSDASNRSSVIGLTSEYTWKEFAFRHAQEPSARAAIQAGTLYFSFPTQKRLSLSRDYLNDSPTYFDFVDGFGGNYAAYAGLQSNHFQDYWAAKNSPVYVDDGTKTVNYPETMTYKMSSASGLGLVDTRSTTVWSFSGYLGHEGFYGARQNKFVFIAYQDTNHSTAYETGITMAASVMNPSRITTAGENTYVVGSDHSLHQKKNDGPYSLKISYEQFKELGKNKNIPVDTTTLLGQLMGVGHLEGKPVVIGTRGYVAICDSTEPDGLNWAWYATPFTNKMTTIHTVSTDDNGITVHVTISNVNKSFTTTDGINWYSRSQQISDAALVLHTLQPFTDYQGRRRFFAAAGRAADAYEAKYWITEEYFNEDGSIAGTGFPETGNGNGGGGNGGGDGGGGSTGTASSLLYDGKRVLVEADARSMTSRINELEDKLARLAPAPEPEAEEAEATEE